MKKILFFAALYTFFVSPAAAQSLSINTDGSTADASAILDIKSTTKGLLIPRMTRTERNSIASPATGLMIFQNGPDSVGLYYYTGSKWTWIFSVANTDSLAWKTGGNIGTVDGNNFIGTRDDIPLTIKVNDFQSGRIDHLKYNSFWGYQAGLSNTTGFSNTGIGYRALQSNTTGHYNTAVGDSALLKNTTGYPNTAIGVQSLQNNTTGFYNTAIGHQALQSNTTSGFNSAVGYQVLQLNTTGFGNTAMGYQALQLNTIGYENTAIGAGALYGNTGGRWNTAIGESALQNNFNGDENVAIGYPSLSLNNGNYNTAIGNGTLLANITGNFNIAMGYQALYNNTGSANTSIGVRALISNTTGYSNIALGDSALQLNINGYNNTAVGPRAFNTNTTGYNNTCLGSDADVAFNYMNNATAIGNGAIVNNNNKIRLGNTAVTAIEGQVAYTFPSDGRFKNNITERDIKGLDFILKLKPVMYNFDTRKFEEFLTKNLSAEAKKKHLEKVDFSISSNIRQSGFVAQDVEKAMKESGYNFNGLHKPADENDNYSLAYSLFVVPLVKATQEQQAQIEMLTKQNEGLKTEIEKIKLQLILLVKTKDQ